MKIVAANDVKRSDATQQHADDLQHLFEGLEKELSAPTWPAWRTWPSLALIGIWRALFPSPNYPKGLRGTDKDDFSYYWKQIDKFSVGQTRPSSGPTLLSASQRFYDGEATRRESINTRCGAVLSTAGILGALVVAAGQLGLMQHKGSFSFAAWIVYVLFVVSLAYLGLSIVTALKVQGDIQGNAVGPDDLLFSCPQQDPDDYAINVAKRNLLYATIDWCLNNSFKFRLNSAQRYLRNGIIAIIAAGVLSPWH